jgi:rod shape-determining protein MreD
MNQLKITIALLIAIVLQWTVRNIADPLAYIDFPLIIVVFAALQRDSIRAILFGAISGIAVDALSGGLLGANGFSKTVIAYFVSEIARRVYLDNLLLRIFVIAAASLLDDTIYYGLHRLFGQMITAPFALTLTYNFIGTTIIGTLCFLFLDYLLTEKLSSQRGETFMQRRRSARRRNPIRLGK